MFKACESYLQGGASEVWSVMGVSSFSLPPFTVSHLLLKKKKKEKKDCWEWWDHVGTESLSDNTTPPQCTFGKNKLVKLWNFKWTFKGEGTVSKYFLLLIFNDWEGRLSACGNLECSSRIVILVLTYDSLTAASLEFYWTLTCAGWGG